MTGPGLPLDGKPWRLAMGLRPLADGDWLQVDGLRAEQLRTKADLLATAHDTVFASLPGTSAAGQLLLDAIVDNLAIHHPGLVEPVAGGMLAERSTGTLVDCAELHPVDAAARLVQEDLCLMVRRGDQWILGAASVCFPSRWSLEAKIGRDLTGIHAPVPGYEETLGPSIRSFFERLRPERPVWRLNWTLLETPTLHLPNAPHVRHAALAPADLWVRVERQTLRRLTGPHGPEAVIAFTIRTTVRRLDEVIADVPGGADALAQTLVTVPAATAAYKGWSGWLSALVSALGQAKLSS